MDTLPALYIIFILLNAFRRGIQRKNIWREHLHRTAFGAVQVFRRQRVALRPRLAFWIALCREAGLVDDYEGQIRITRHARQWLGKPSEEQTFHLIVSWQNAPKNRKVGQFRKKLLWKLKHEQPLTQKDMLALNGLEALGLVAAGRLTRWGMFFLKGEGRLPTPKPIEPCQIQDEHFIASLPQHTDLLWDLEKHLRPASPGRYPLTKRALHFHAGDPFELISLLERGLQKGLPTATRALILNQPSLHVMEGFVIEFSNSNELSELRRQPDLRRHTGQFLSPRHVFVPAKEAGRILPMFERRGVHLIFHEEPPEIQKKRTHFTRRVLLQPVGKSVPKMGLLQKYLRLQQALDILYRAPGYPAEQRRITPLAIEERGGYTYVIAYCQTRRAQPQLRGA